MKFGIRQSETSFHFVWHTYEKKYSSHVQSKTKDVETEATDVTLYCKPDTTNA